MAKIQSTTQRWEDGEGGNVEVTAEVFTSEGRTGVGIKIDRRQPERPTAVGQDPKLLRSVTHLDLRDVEAVALRDVLTSLLVVTR